MFRKLQFFYFFRHFAILNVKPALLKHMIHVRPHLFIYLQSPSLVVLREIYSVLFLRHLATLNATFSDVSLVFIVIHKTLALNFPPDDVVEISLSTIKSLK